MCSHTPLSLLPHCAHSFDCSALSAEKRERAAELQGEILRLTSEFTTNVNQHRPQPSLSDTQLLDTVSATLHARLRSKKDGKNAMVDADVRNNNNNHCCPSAHYFTHTVSYCRTLLTVLSWPQTILTWSSSEHHRRLAYIHAGQSHTNNLPVLQQSAHTTSNPLALGRQPAFIDTHFSFAHMCSVVR